MKISPLADLLTQIRNGQVRKKEVISVGYQSRLCRNVLDCLVQEGWLLRWTYDEPSFEKNQTNYRKSITKVKIFLKFSNNFPVIQNLVLVSKPRRAVYVSKKELISSPLQEKHIPSMQSRIKFNRFKNNPLGSWVLSTSKGILTDHQAIQISVGGELLFYVR